ncbi:MAG: substrate-binding domain-containing protein [Candidatus Marinimicrobia bacterium]|nr:substrate-binding domain-containing protein [Candidatus Neomarinimicrobiota bacterium]
MSNALLQNKALALIQRGIQSGRLITGENRLRSTREIAEFSGLTPSTVHLALKELVRQNVLRSHWGKGYTLPEKADPDDILYQFVMVSSVFDQVARDDTWFGQEILRAVYEACKRYKLSIAHYHPASRKWIARMLKESAMLDGLLMTEPDRQLEAAAVAAHLPCVRLSTFPPGEPPTPGVPRVGCCRNEAAYLITRHVLEQGRRRIALACAPHIEYQRREGFTRAFEEKGWAPGPILHVPCDNQQSQIEETYRVLRARFKQRAVPFEGILLATDMMAVGAIRLFKEMGLTLGQDIILAGFDGNAQAFLHYGPFCTVKTGLADALLASVGCLVSQLREEALPQPDIHLPPKILCHHTCGRPRG